ncbi:hypothetical protein B0H10DRAFT_1938662 [Mycena sp. CBHHK59/15]|nr:hypothetical protein B0H10DRAFT_1938662 [Mycena sp. CBHHK59/15]
MNPLAWGRPLQTPLMLATGPAAWSFPFIAEAHCMVLHMFFWEMDPPDACRWAHCAVHMIYQTSDFIQNVRSINIMAGRRTVYGLWLYDNGNCTVDGWNRTHTVWEDFYEDADNAVIKNQAQINFWGFYQAWF